MVPKLVDYDKPARENPGSAPLRGPLLGGVLKLPLAGLAFWGSGLMQCKVFIMITMFKQSEAWGACKDVCGPSESSGPSVLSVQNTPFVPASSMSQARVLLLLSPPQQQCTWFPEEVWEPLYPVLREYKLSWSHFWVDTGLHWKCEIWTEDLKLVCYNSPFSLGDTGSVIIYHRVAVKNKMMDTCMLT